MELSLIQAFHDPIFIYPVIKVLNSFPRLEEVDSVIFIKNIFEEEELILKRGQIEVYKSFSSFFYKKFLALVVKEIGKLRKIINHFLNSKFEEFYFFFENSEISFNRKKWFEMGILEKFKFLGKISRENSIIENLEHLIVPTDTIKNDDLSNSLAVYINNNLNLLIIILLECLKQEVSKNTNLSKEIEKTLETFLGLELNKLSYFYERGNLEKTTFSIDMAISSEIIILVNNSDFKDTGDLLKFLCFAILYLFFILDCNT